MALQCISPGLPTFPLVIRDAMVKSKSIQEAQRKIIAQRMKDNGGSFSQPLSGSDGKILATLMTIWILIWRSQGIILNQVASLPPNLLLVQI